MCIFSKLANKIKSYINKEYHRYVQFKEYERKRELQLEEKCAKCNTQECLWTSGYCPN